PAHCHPYTWLRQLKNQQSTGNGNNRRDRNNPSHVIKPYIFKHIGQWILHIKLGIMYHPCQYQGNSDIQYSTDNQTVYHSLGQVPLGIFTFLCRRRDRIEADKSKEYGSYTAKHPSYPIRRKRCPVFRFDKESSSQYDGKDDTDLDNNHDIARLLRLLDPDIDQPGHQNGDQPR